MSLTTLTLFEMRMQTLRPMDRKSSPFLSDRHIRRRGTISYGVLCILIQLIQMLSSVNLSWMTTICIHCKLREALRIIDSTFDRPVLFRNFFGNQIYQA